MMDRLFLTICAVVWLAFMVVIVVLGTTTTERTQKISQTFQDCTTDGDCEGKAYKFCTDLFGEFRSPFDANGNPRR